MHIFVHFVNSFYIVENILVFTATIVSMYASNLYIYALGQISSRFFHTWQNIRIMFRQQAMRRILASGDRI
jgi:hypothetical protein